MGVFIEPIGKLINQFTKLPGVGSKTAQRYAYKIINMTEEEAEEFVKAISECKQKVKYCSICGNFTENDVCDICLKRKHDTVCVVKEPKDILAFERIHEFNGVYHVLHGTIKPSENKGPKDITIDKLIKRIEDENIKEVVMATNPDFDGEITASYISALIKPLNVKVTRLAHGIPIGTDIEYADEMTLTKAFTDRKEI